jgi:cobalt-zinc-cadmium resistance protein CzcA
MTTEDDRTSQDALGHFVRHVVQQRWLVMMATTALAALGVFNFARLPIDAVPDITNVQVQVNTAVQGLAPVDVEKLVSFPIETAMAGLPRLQMTRSLSRYGLSQVTVIFEDGTDIYFARQLVNERLQEVRGALPPDLADPAMGPIATGLGEIFMWTVEAEPGAVRPDGAPYTAMDLREIEDWIVKPQLRTVPGVTEVNTIGGYEKQYHVTPDPERLLAYGITLHDVLVALEANNAAAGAGWIDSRGEQYLVNTMGRLESVDDIREVVVATRDGVPIHVHDVATVDLGRQLRTGAATERGREVVLGTAFMLIGENSRTVAQRLAKKLEEVNRGLPRGVVATPVYDRTELVDATLHTVRTNLVEGAALVVAVLLLLLGNVVGALVVALVIPLSMLFAVTGMVENRISANLLSLGAIDFGIIVDGAVVMVENMVRRFGERQHALGRLLDRHERLQEAWKSAAEVARPTLFGLGIIMIVYVPILTLSGIEGKMFRPMAQVVLLALAGALLFAFTFVPAAVALALRGRVSHEQSPALRLAQRAYVPTLRAALRFRVAIVAAAAVLVVLCLWLAPRLGSEFLPTLDEGDFAIHALRIPGTSLEQAVLMQHEVELALLSFPEVANVYAKIGTAEIATDPMPPSVADVFVIMRPREGWPDPDRAREDLIEAFESKLNLLPGNVYEYTQPIAMRFNELIAGVRSDVAVKVFGDDLDVLRETAKDIEAILRDVPGASDVKTEQVSGLPILTVDVDRAAISRYGLSVAEVQDVVSIALGGREAGEVFEGDRRFKIVVRHPEEIRADLERLEFLPIPVPAGDGHDPQLAGVAPAFHRSGGAEFVPLGAVARLDLQEGANQVSRENGKRRVVVQVNVRGRDIGSFVAEAQERVSVGATIPPGYWIDWGGQFENLIAARKRLAVVVPLALFSIFVLLFTAFGSAKDASLVFTGVPLALTGGVVALAVRGMPFSISAGVGLIALSGVAVLNGLVMVTFIRRLREGGLPLERAVLEGCTTRLRPILMTALVASLGFVPMALATGRGAEVQRPVATVVIGGILSSTLLTLVVLPAVYRLVHRDREERAEP